MNRATLSRVVKLERRQGGRPLAFSADELDAVLAGMEADVTAAHGSLEAAAAACAEAGDVEAAHLLGWWAQERRGGADVAAWQRVAALVP
ncbi:hypothetical protein [Salinarimonas soli]|uniref:Uncharacterized protein n=1 Tax=Salinarimonas soli TaxID=1638099 RepID=A0A5B2VSG2_9HYPH|nr:hypothetical protein [Salinarimonas soli]KAA2241147.1 hypothetical protein F0L46_04945 [Salinarimonas soli]